MPIKELLALTAMILGGIFVAHPLGFPHAIRTIERTILKEISRTDDWGNPSFGTAREYIRLRHSR